MNSDRSDIIDPQNSEWNAWLLNQAIDFTMQLLVSDWADRFGASAYLCCARKEGQKTAFADALWKRLSEEACWATREPKKSAFAKAADLVMPDSEELDGFLSASRYPADFLQGEQEVRELLIKLGAKKFTMNSLIRLRCAGEDGTRLKTRLGSGEANYHFTNFQQGLQGVDTQVMFARAIQAKWPLPSSNREDLESTTSTLADDGTLASPSAPLWRVEKALIDFAPVPPGSRLHRSLLDFKFFAKLKPVKSYDPSGWAIDAAIRADDGKADQATREALYKFILSSVGLISRRAKLVLRRSPVLMDHRGGWARPKHIVLRKARGSRDLEPVLHFPHSDYARDKALASVFKFRTRVIGSDLVSYARLVEQQRALAEGFEQILARMANLLTPPVVRQLKGVAFLRSSLDEPASPSNVYRRTSLTEACLGPEAPFVLGSNQKLYERLECLDMPRVEDVIRHLRALRQNNQPPQASSILYPGLVAALTKEKTPTSTYKSEPLLWIGNAYHAPDAVLLGARHRQVFFDAVPVELARNSPVARAFQRLGASEEPQERHWAMLLAWFHDRFLKSGAALSVGERRSLRQAYLALGDAGVPTTLPAHIRCLLDYEGKLYSKSDAAMGLYVINNDPLLAEAIMNSGSSYAFADTEQPGVLGFLSASGVKTLTGVRAKVGVQLGTQRETTKQPWLDAVARSLHQRELASALASLLAFSLKGTGLPKPPSEAHIRKTLLSWKRLTCVDRIGVDYRVAAQVFTVPVGAWAKDERIYIVPPKKRQDVLAAVSEVITQSIAPPELRGILLDAVQVLLDCDSVGEYQRYLARRGIAWSRPTANGEAPPEEVEYDDDLDAIIEAELEGRISNLLNQDQTLPEPAPVPPGKPVSPVPPTPGKNQEPLPPIESVLLEEIPPDATWSPPMPLRGVGGSGGSGVPRPIDRRRDEEIGRRGEDLIYRRELERVSALGYPKDRVVWVAKDNPNADHDIRSLDDDGQDFVIEVKSTVGRDGRFNWPRAEFKRAHQERSRYVLCRVYEADSNRPKVKRFRDPVGLLLKDALRLDIDTLAAQVEPLD
jgi:hypothetical protein